MTKVRFSFIAAVITVFAAVSACSPDARYRALDFFFDGVPPPGEKQNKNVAGKQKDLRKRADGAPRARSHGPYEAKLCNACHERGGSNKLILPVEKLCLNCHDLNLKTRHIHGPVASGGCRVCHDPHGSGKPFLLVAEPTQFCFYCHDETEVRSHEVHQDATGPECTDCHNPHGSNNDFLLK